MRVIRGRKPNREIMYFYFNFKNKKGNSRIDHSWLKKHVFMFILRGQNKQKVIFFQWWKTLFKTVGIAGDWGKISQKRKSHIEKRLTEIEFNLKHFFLKLNTMTSWDERKTHNKGTKDP